LYFSSTSTYDSTLYLNLDNFLLTAVDCQHPGTIENGRVIVMNQTTTYNSAVEYHCVPHYQRTGPYLRKCMEDGTWSGEEPRCESECHLCLLTWLRLFCICIWHKLHLSV